jgi:ADP-ribose pyrophosphatase YjhB (NUDIX family)
VENLSHTENQPLLKHLSLDCVIFGFHDNQLKVLLLHMKHTKEWALPGGFVRANESVETAAARVLNERTGLREIFLQQFHVFSDPTVKRQPGGIGYAYSRGP